MGARLCGHVGRWVKARHWTVIGAALAAALVVAASAVAGPGTPGKAHSAAKKKAAAPITKAQLNAAVKAAVKAEVKALRLTSGKAGANGTNGATGPVGAKGDAGAKGDTGAAGAAGADGAKGDTGEAGTGGGAGDGYFALTANGGFSPATGPQSAAVTVPAGNYIVNSGCQATLADGPDASVGLAQSVITSDNDTTGRTTVLAGVPADGATIPFAGAHGSTQNLGAQSLNNGTKFVLPTGGTITETCSAMSLSDQPLTFSNVYVSAIPVGAIH